MNILGHGNIKAKIHRTYTPLEYLLHAIQEQSTISKTWIQTTNAPNPRTREHQPREEGEELYRDPWHLEEEGEVEQTLQLNGEKGLHG